MGFEDFEGFWRVTVSNSEECEKDSIVVFDRTNAGEVTILCVKPSFPYGEGTGSFKPDDTIEVTVKGELYAISLIPGDPPQITFGRKVSGPGPAAGSWTAEDYVPGSASEPAGE